jgi:hypothetical protein
MPHKKTNFKLPHSRWEELADITRTGLPKHGRPGEILCENIFNEIKDSIESDRRRAKLEPARQDWITLSKLVEALAYDGVVIGVGFNQPELVAPALKLTRRLKLLKTARMLQALRRARHATDPGLPISLLQRRNGLRLQPHHLTHTLRP